MKHKDSELAIGVFDSGMGGISVLSELIALMPNEKYIYFGDSLNAPYGIKSVDKIIDLSIEACEFLIRKGVKSIVVACNTATSAAIKILRKRNDIPIIGMEPAIKPALAIHDDKKIIVIATPITLKERKFHKLLNDLDANSKIIKIPAPELVRIVESGKIKDDTAINQIREYFEAINLDTVGSIVLGCTHFIFLRDAIRQVVGEDIELIDGNIGTSRHLYNTLKRMNLLRETSFKGVVEFYNSCNDNKMIERSKELFDYLINI